MGEGAAVMSEHEREDWMEGDVAPGERTPDQIEHEIERTRERMSNNIDALGERLSPGNLKRQAKDAIAEKAQDVVANVGDQARQTGSRVIDFITANPLPVAAVSLGAIWLFSHRKGSRSEVSGDRMARFAYTGPERRQPDGRSRLGRRLVDRAESIGHAVGDAATHAGERVAELKGRAQERASELGTTARARARDARGGLERMMDDNPLALAAGAVIVGIALGMLLPETETERRVMGEARDELADRVSDAASRVKEIAVEAGRDVQETVREEVDQRAPEIKSSLEDAAEHVKEQVKASAGRVAREAKETVRRPPPNLKG
jgi:ElaB/YqjD/DUF883 family membrane-anchored ribosome-binding protein